MRKRFFLLGLCVVLVGASPPGTPLIDTPRADPSDIPVKKVTPVLFTARVANDAQHTPTSVRLLRLQWSGNEKSVSRMWDDGSNGDQTAKDGVYTCDIKLKEPIIGLLSFRVEVKYKQSRTPVRSQAIFVNIVGGS